MHRILCFTLVLAPLWLGCASGVHPVTEATTNVASSRAPEAAFAPLEPLFAQSPVPPLGAGAAAAKSSVASEYTCPMHHQVHETKPGKCPICGMTLVPVAAAPAAPAAPERGQR